jgi:hypothetical protein
MTRCFGSGREASGYGGLSRQDARVLSGACDETHVPTATATRVHHAHRRRRAFNDSQDRSALIISTINVRWLTHARA